MKKAIFYVPLIMSMLLLACTNENQDSQSATQGDPDSSRADSLQKEVSEGHDIGMAKMGKIDRLQKQAQHIVDSLGKLPDKARVAAAPYKQKLDSVLKDLDYAEFVMYKWMEEYRYDSAFNNINEKIDYLLNEKVKVNKMKETIMMAVEKADSVLTKKF